ncbi:hypothetical protein BD410DRAFT_847146 [Rickenella mellea]|uniref:Uncharacterized protein n=1 Tax=Rickenella mellea TaxID=50990 RepID=A0A4Y7PDB7_9AGAM|nr:hypothetical protein BD410DRAFT_847146 [Rickenella mellea]
MDVDDDEDDEVEDEEDDEDEDALADYCKKGIRGVFTFVSQRDDLVVPLKVQMIVAEECPLDTILSFHSTIVMNLISHQAAYCLFAWTTLEDRHGVVVQEEVKRTRHKAALAKYAARGFNIITRDEAKRERDKKHRSSLRSGERWVDDRLAWVIPLDMANRNDVTLSASTLGTPQTMCDPVTLNSWMFGKHEDDPGPSWFGVPLIQFTYISSKLLRFKYTASHEFLHFVKPILCMTGSAEYKKRKEYPSAEFWTWYLNIS